MNRSIISLLLLIMLLTLNHMQAQFSAAADATVARIGDKEITFSEYRTILTNYYKYWEEQWQRPLTREDRIQLYRRCWDDVINRHIYDEEISRRNMTITTEELEMEMLQNPPTAVKNLKDIHTNGRFDPQKYRQALKERPEFKTYVMDYVRVVYRYQKLIDLLKTEVVVNADSLRNIWYRDADTASAKIIFFDFNKLSDHIATDEEVEAYYQRHLADYSRSNGRRLRYIHIPFQPSQTDSLAAYSKADSLYRRLIAGVNFATLAARYSDDPGSSQNDGDLGWFGRGAMIPEFERASFDNPPGSVIKPFATRFGWHIVEVLDRRQDAQGNPVVNARHILVRHETSSQTLRNLKILQARIHQEALVTGLDIAAIKYDIRVQETTFFSATDRIISGIGTVPLLVKVTFENPVGTILHPFTNPHGDFFVGQVWQSADIYHLPLDSVRREVAAQATVHKRVKAMQDYARDFYRRYGPQTYMREAANAGLTVVEHTGIHLESNIPLIGRVDTLNQAILAVEKGSFTPLVGEGNHIYLALITDRQRPTEQLWQKEKDAYLAQAADEIRTRAITNWYYRQVQALDIEDNRKAFFDPAND